jgi:hypothetical protein
VSRAGATTAPLAVGGSVDATAGTLCRVLDADTGTEADFVNDADGVTLVVSCRVVDSVV